MKKTTFSGFLGMLLAVAACYAQNTTGTTTLSVNVGAEAALSIGSSTALSSTGTTFSNYTGTTSLTYYVRTNAGGSITLEVTGDFSPTGGPSVGTPPTAGDKLTYNCSMNQPGTHGSVTNCTSGLQAMTSSATNVATFTSDARSVAAGNTGTVSWTMTNDPAYKAGTYNSTVTFTISAT